MNQRETLKQRGQIKSLSLFKKKRWWLRKAGVSSMVRAQLKCLCGWLDSAKTNDGSFDHSGIRQCNFVIVANNSMLTLLRTRHRMCQVYLAAFQKTVMGWVMERITVRSHENMSANCPCKPTLLTWRGVGNVLPLVSYIGPCCCSPPYMNSFLVCVCVCGCVCVLVSAWMRCDPLQPQRLINSFLTTSEWEVAYFLI